MTRATKIILGTIAILIFIILMSIISTCISLAKGKKPITTSEFISIMENNGYSVIDTKSQNVEDYIKKSSKAISNREEYQIEFYEFSNVAYATQFYNNNVIKLMEDRNKSFTETNRGGKNFSKYILSTDEYYSIVSRIDNTVIYLNVNLQYNSEITSVLDKLGY